MKKINEYLFVVLVSVFIYMTVMLLKTQVTSNYEKIKACVLPIINSISTFVADYALVILASLLGLVLVTACIVFVIYWWKETVKNFNNGIENAFRNGRPYDRKNGWL